MSEGPGTEVGSGRSLEEGEGLEQGVLGFHSDDSALGGSSTCGSPVLLPGPH